ncbi:MAG: NAD-dependent epimerase/dehydratase family protein, partial [Chloroflexi bacterium]|nr:NAD-dependent epimerase/dehydratase family protein [Chloroflexota bacterium]
IWGTGTPQREFIFADDLADACIFVMTRYDGPQPINLGCGSGMSIADLAMAIKEVTGYRGRIHFDTSKPDGMPVKLLDSSKLRALGWRPKVSFHSALLATYEWFRQSPGARLPAPERNGHEGDQRKCHSS